MYNVSLGGGGVHLRFKENLNLGIQDPRSKALSLSLGVDKPTPVQQGGVGEGT
jgi:hypothetical protein